MNTAVPFGVVAPPTRPRLVVWLLSDGKPGHVNQSLGLLRALRNAGETAAHTIAVGERWPSIVAWASGRFPPGAALPDPHLIIAAGHATHFAALAARRARGGRIIVLMKPSLPLSWFDLCIVPEHDLDQPAENVLVTRGVLSPLFGGQSGSLPVRSGSRRASTFGPQHTAASGKARSRGLILIGGPSKHHRWVPCDLQAQLQQVVTSEPTRQWVLTTSRRTPESFVRGLLRWQADNLHVVPFSETTPDWLAEQWAASSSVFVTDDSLSMIYEALTAGADVGLLSVPCRRQDRVVRAVERLVTDRLVVPLEDWLSHRFDRRRRERFNEADRCARFVREHLLDAA